MELSIPPRDTLGEQCLRKKQTTRLPQAEGLTQLFKIGNRELHQMLLYTFSVKVVTVSVEIV